MEPQLKMLIRLQELDNEIGGLQRKLGEIPGKVNELKTRYRVAEEELERVRAEIEASQKESRRAERDLDTHLEKIRKLQDQQYLVKTNKEYQALLSELNRLKDEQSELEEKILTLMEDGGKVETSIVTLEQKVSHEKSIFQAGESRLLKESERQKTELEALEARRKELTSGITEENLQTYTKVKKYRGVAVAEVRNEICLGCRVSLPPQKYADVMKNDSVGTCSHCHRVLYYKRPEGQLREDEQ